MLLTRTLTLTLFISGLIFSCSGPPAQPAGTQSDLPRLEDSNTTSETGSTGGGLLPSSGEEVYENRYLPASFGLALPSSLEAQSSASAKTLARQESTVDLNKCYIDELVSDGAASSQLRRLCGLKFSQARLEIEALFLDRALPGILAHCQGRLNDCELDTQTFTLTVNSAVVNRLNLLMGFYRLTGLEEYSRYRGVTLAEGAKIPYRVDRLVELDSGPYDYKAVVLTDIISTQGSDVETRSDAGTIEVLWDRAGHHLAFEFKTVTTVFDWDISARRSYVYNLVSGDLDYWGHIGYWQGDYTLQQAAGMVIRPCDKEDCITYSNSGIMLSGNDLAPLGFDAAEAPLARIRHTSALFDGTGGVFDNRYPDGRTAERVILNSGAEPLYQLVETAGSWQTNETVDQAWYDSLASDPYQQSAENGGLDAPSGYFSTGTCSGDSVLWYAADAGLDLQSVRGIGLCFAGSASALQSEPAEPRAVHLY